MTRKPLTALQRAYHDALTVCTVSTGVGAPLVALWLYNEVSSLVLFREVLVVCMVPFAMLLLARMNTEVAWRAREEKFARMVARMAS